MKIAVRVIELAGHLILPDDLQDYDAVKLFGTVNGEVKGTAMVYNAHKALWQKAKFRYAEDFGSWLMLANILFSPEGRPAISQDTVKMLLASRLGISTENLAVYNYIPPVLPPLTASIVIPTKGRPDDLERALTHLTNHISRVPHEIIIVDNNPKSKLTYPVVKKFPGVKYFTEERPGVGYARNTGNWHAQGDIIICTDDDVVVSEHWLDHLIAPFSDPDVGAVASLILPLELETYAQQIKDELTRFYIPEGELRFGPAYFNQEYYPDLNRFGNTSSVAFRYSTFADPKIGPFEVALGAGSKTGGGGDIYQYYKLLAAGMTIIYTPKSYVFHRHRDTMQRLKRQLHTINSGFVARNVLLVTRHKDKRYFKLLLHDMPLHQASKVFKKLIGRHHHPMEIILKQLGGMMVGPLNLWRSLRYCKKLGNFTAEQFAERMRNRQPLTVREVENANLFR
jgi:glycosyltransferase involved in cell wall biosynthesis